MIKHVGKYSYYVGPIQIIDWGDKTKSVYIGSFTSISKNLKIVLSDGCHYYKTGTTYTFEEKEFRTGLIREHASRGNVVIGNDVWIGQDVTIMSGVTIGDGAVIATNSHVVKDVEPYSIHGGNPAKFIKHRFDKCVVDILAKIKWWEYPDDTIKEIVPLLQKEMNESVAIQIEKSLVNKSKSSVTESSRFFEIDKIYKEVLRRDSDWNGLMAYVESNLSLDQVKQDMMNSDEYKRKN